MIAASPQVGYIHEPFNVTRSNFGASAVPCERWFTYVTEENERRFYDSLHQTLRFRYNWRSAVRSVAGSRRLTPALKTWRRLNRNRRGGLRPLLKDPLALLSAEWIARRFDAQVLVLIRHPAAFASSLKQLGWRFPFGDLLEQPALMHDHLVPFEESIRKHADVERPIIEQAALLWRILYHIVARYEKEHPDWVFCRHEDISRRPEEMFGEIFEWLALPFSEEVRGTILLHSTSSNPVERAADRKQEIRRHSRANVWTWKQRLSPDEIDSVRGAVHDVARLYYSDEDW